MDDERIIEIERLNAAVQLARGCFHQFGNMLTLIGGYGSLVKDSLDPGSEEAELLERIQAASREASALLDDTHRFVRGKPAAAERVDACRVAREVSALMEATFPRITVTARTPGEPVPVMASPRRLFDALMHLVLNAFQALDGTGTIRIEVAAEGESAVLSVSDDGPGIPEKDLERVLEPGTTGRGGDDTFSTGLGLPAARAIARQVDGTLGLECPSGGGLRADLRLPLAGTR
jgi:signal transduction histidine kinase